MVAALVAAAAVAAAAVTAAAWSSAECQESKDKSRGRMCCSQRGYIGEVNRH